MNFRPAGWYNSVLCKGEKFQCSISSPAVLGGRYIPRQWSCCIGNELNYCKLLSSKLASLFGGSSKKTEGENESLRYTAPKEPKKKKPGKTYATLQKTKNGVFIQIMHLFHCLLNGNKHKHL